MSPTRDFLIRVDSITSLVAHRGLDTAAKAELLEVSAEARRRAELYTDDEAELGRIFKRFLVDPDRSPAEAPFVNLFGSTAGGDLILDGSIGLTPEEVQALERLGVEAHQ